MKNPIARIAAATLIAVAAGQASAALFTDLRVVKNNLKPGMWSIEIEPYKVKGKYVSPPPSRGCATVQQLMDKLALPLSYNTHTKKETKEAPTTIAEDFADHGRIEVMIPAIPGVASSVPTLRTLEVKMVDKSNFVIIAGPGNLTTVRASYLGKCKP